LSTLIDENILVKQMIEGNYQAFDRLYHQYAQEVFVRIKKIVISHSVAEELHQDVFLKIWQQRERLDIGVPFKAIAFQTAKNLAINHYWKATRDEKLKAHLISQATAHYHHLDEHINFNATNEALQKAISQLPPQRKKIFISCKMEGRSYEATAVEMSISLSTVKDHMNKAMRALRKHMRSHLSLLLIFLEVLIA